MSKKYLIDTQVLIFLTDRNLVDIVYSNLDIYITESVVKEYYDEFDIDQKLKQEKAIRESICSRLRSQKKVIEPYKWILRDKSFCTISATYNIVKESGINDAELCLFSHCEECQENYIIVSDEKKVLKSLHKSQEKMSWSDFLCLVKRLDI